MKKIIPLCLCAVLALGLAACRGVAEKPFDVNFFIPRGASVIEQMPGHTVLEIRNNPFELVVESYERALLLAGMQQVELDDTNDAFWTYTGTYEGNLTLKISIRDGDGKVRVLLDYFDEMRKP